MFPNAKFDLVQHPMTEHEAMKEKAASGNIVDGRLTQCHRNLMSSLRNYFAYKAIFPRRKYILDFAGVQGMGCGEVT